MRMDLVGSRELKADGSLPTEGMRFEIKEVVMAKVIEFYIPTHFRKPLNWAPRMPSGRLIEFRSQARKSA